MPKPPSEAQTALRRLHHEMRTPLGQIIGYSEMLQEETRERGLEELLPDLAKIQQAARTLLELVDRVFQDGAGMSPSASQPTPAGEAMEAPSQLSGNGTRGAHILLVDDEPNNRDMLARRLGRHGYRVSCAADGRAALHTIEQQEFELVLLDVMMPGMSGLEVLEALRRTRSAAELPVIMVTALDDRENTVAALSRGANDYVIKPIDFPIVLARVESQLSLRRAVREVESLAQQLAFRNDFIRRVFGRYVSDEIVEGLLESPEGLELSGEKREVSILLSDLRGFSSLTEELAPTEIVSLLNTYLGTMSEVIQAHRGTIDEFIGDGILAFFGAPIARDDDAERAVACAVAMQQAMASVNDANRRRGLPEIEMGIGIATGEAVIGNIGSERRTKYGAVGSTVNLAGRIESYTLGGEIWISEATREALRDVVEVANLREVHPKGLDAPIRIHRVTGVGGRYDLRLAADASEFVELSEELPVRFAVLEGKQVASASTPGRIWALSANAAKIRSAEPVGEMSDVRIEFSDEDADGACYAKVVSGSTDPDATFTVRFTTRSVRFGERLKLAMSARS